MDLRVIKLQIFTPFSYGVIATTPHHFTPQQQYRINNGAIFRFSLAHVLRFPPYDKTFCRLLHTRDVKTE